jgi:hypothetical protein
MPSKTTTPKPRPKTKTRTPIYNRRTNTKKRKHRSWVWWILVLMPIAISVWLIAEPLLYEAKVDTKATTTAVEERRVPGRLERSRPPVISSERPQPRPDDKTEPKNGDGFKEDVDWALGHMYKLLPIMISLIAILKRGAIMGRAR